MAVVALTLVDNWYDLVCMELFKMVACCYDMRLANVRRTYVCCKILLVMLSQAFFLLKKIVLFSLVFNPLFNNFGFPVDKLYWPYCLFWLWFVHPWVSLFRWILWVFSWCTCYVFRLLFFLFFLIPIFSKYMGCSSKSNFIILHCRHLLMVSVYIVILFCRGTR